MNQVLPILLTRNGEPLYLNGAEVLWAKREDDRTLLWMRGSVNALTVDQFPAVIQTMIQDVMKGN